MPGSRTGSASPPDYRVGGTGREVERSPTMIRLDVCDEVVAGVVMSDGDEVEGSWTNKISFNMRSANIEAECLRLRHAGRIQSRKQINNAHRVLPTKRKKTMRKERRPDEHHALPGATGIKKMRYCSYIIRTIPRASRGRGCRRWDYMDQSPEATTADLSSSTSTTGTRRPTPR